MTFKCFEKVMYMGNTVTIVGVTRRGASRYGSGIVYDVRIDRGTHSYDYKNIPEKHLTAIVKKPINEVLEFTAEANRLKKNRHERVT